MQALPFSRCIGIQVVVQATGHRLRHGTPSQTKHGKTERREAPKCGRATRTDVATRSRFGRGARHRTSPCGNRLLRARCASRRSTAIRRPGCRPPQI